eukprot:4709042-Pleurochrysis_carterae.AAC.2
MACSQSEEGRLRFAQRTAGERALRRTARESSAKRRPKGDRSTPPLVTANACALRLHASCLHFHPYTMATAAPLYFFALTLPPPVTQPPSTDADDLRASLLRLLWRGACGNTNASETSRRHVAATLALLGWQPTVVPCLERSNGVVKLAPRDALRCKEDARTLLLANYLPLDQATLRSGTFCTPHNAASNAASDAKVAPRVASHATSHAQAHAAAAASERVLATSPAAGATAKTTAHSASASASASAPSARCDGALGASTPPAKRLRVQSAEDAEADAPTPLDPVAEHRRRCTRMRARVRTDPHLRMPWVVGRGGRL